MKGSRPARIPYYDLPADCPPVKLPPSQRIIAYAELRGLGYPGYLVRKYLGYSTQNFVRRFVESHPRTQAALAALQDQVGLRQEDVLIGLLEAQCKAKTQPELLRCWIEIARLMGFFPNQPANRHPVPDRA